MLTPILEIPRMSKMAIACLINQIVAHLPPDPCYLNVDVWNGYSLLTGMLGNPHAKIIGVDSFSQFDGPREAFLERFHRHRSRSHEFHDMDYEKYLHERHEGLIGFYFYAGHHAYEHQLRALEVAEPHLSDEALIMVDDTNWEEPRRATMDFVARSSHSYEVLADIRTAVTTHTSFWNGLIVLRRG